MAQIGLEESDAAPRPVQIPRSAAADVVVQGAGAILGEDAYPVNVGVDAVAEREVDDAIAAAEDDGRFRSLFREDAEAVALAARQDHGDHPFHGRCAPCAGDGPLSGVESMPANTRRMRSQSRR